MINSTYKPHSADVRLTLGVNGNDYDVAKVGPDRIFMRTAIGLPVTDAELLISVDGRVTTSQIQLSNGASVNCQAVETR